MSGNGEQTGLGEQKDLGGQSVSENRQIGEAETGVWMAIWSFWEEISRIMAILCLVTAGAACVAAGILLVREELTGKLWETLKSESGRRTGILVIVAAGVWILVIGHSVSAAEVPTAETGTVNGAEAAPLEATSEAEAAAPDKTGTSSTEETGTAAPEEMGTAAPD